MVEDNESPESDKRDRTRGAFKIQDEQAKHIYNNTWYQDEKPVEMFRTDLISAMKIPDHQQLTEGQYIRIRDAWKEEYDRGVQVPVDADCHPTPNFTKRDYASSDEWRRPDKYFSWTAEKDVWDEVVSGVTPHVVYDMDENDMTFLDKLNFSLVGIQRIEEILFESVITHLDSSTHIGMVQIFQNDTGYSIEHDDTVACEVCHDVYSEPDNEMVFCDRCNICVHQSCYGILKIPSDEWFCCPCSKSFEAPVCLLCMQGGGAFKMTDNHEWVHLFCALWVPECQFGNTDKMEPVTKIGKIPTSRWALSCVICQKRVGACIQCSQKSCKVSYHVTCAFQSSLLMMTEFETNLEEIKNVSYCPKHSSSFRETSLPTNAIILQNSGANNTIYQEKMVRLNKIKDQFYEYVDRKTVMATSDLPESVFAKIFNYWKEKRLKNGNNPLIILPPLENVAIQKEQSKPNQTKETQEDIAVAPMLRLVSLRQELERARMMCTMVEKRERLKKRLLTAAISVFEKQFEEGQSLEFMFTKLGIPDVPVSMSFAEVSMVPSDASMSKIICSPTQQEDAFAFGNESLIVAVEQVVGAELKEVKASSPEIKTDSDWIDSDKERSRKKRSKKRKPEAKKESTKEPSDTVEVRSKLMIAFSDKSDCHTSQDEFSHFTTPPTSPEYPLPDLATTTPHVTSDKIKSIYAMLEKSPLKQSKNPSPHTLSPDQDRLTPRSDKEMSPIMADKSAASRKRKDITDSDGSMKSYGSKNYSPVSMSKTSSHRSKTSSPISRNKNPSPSKPLKLKDSSFLDEILSISPAAKRSKLKISPSGSRSGSGRSS